MSELRIMDKDAGDLKVIWDKSNIHEVEAAEEQFNKLVKKGFSAFSVNAKGDKGSKITEFDLSAEKIIMVPKVQGG